MSVIRIGGGQAGYGDAIEPISHQLDAGIDYLVCDALAESTLAVLQKDRQRDSSLGYTRDIGEYIQLALPYLRTGRTRFIGNAGGLNPVGARDHLMHALRESGVRGLKIATVLGDDLTPLRESLGIPSNAVFANAYLGARPVVSALALGADIVLTGRVADASMFLAPLIHEHGWAWDDWPRLAAGITVGHLLECAAQASGSVYSGDWWAHPSPQRPGYPIAEVDADGVAVVTKPEKAGGRVSFDTVREQLLYEVHDPTAYLNPDVTVDLAAARLTDLGDDRVRVDQLRGAPPPQTYKGLYCTASGWAGDWVKGFSWPDAEAKARAVLRTFRAQIEDAGLAVDEFCEEYFGAGAYHGDAAGEDLELARRAGWEPPEVLARFAWRCADAETARAVSSVITRRGGQTMAMGAPFGRPKRRRPTELLSLRSLAVPREHVDDQVRVSVDVV